MILTKDSVHAGLLDQKIYQHDVTHKVGYKRRPINEKESYRWIEGLKLTSNLITNKTVITIPDRESDVFKLFFEANKLNIYILIRAANDRMISE